MINPTTANDNEPAYTGHIRDAATGLNYMQARYQDPVIGRFLSIDPVGFTPDQPFMFNRYAYVGNDPINAWDPNGLAACPNCPQTLDEARAAANDPVNKFATKVLVAEMAVATLFIPGPEDAIIAVAAVTKVGQVLTKVGTVANKARKAAKVQKNLLKSEKSLSRNVEEHVKKLADFKKNPDKFDNKGLLKNATPENRKKIINGRIKSIEKQIIKNQRELEKVQKILKDN